MKKHKALVVDDERLARKSLINLLDELSEIEVVAEAEDVKSAVEAIKQHQPDVVFLDIQMPGATGFELLDYIDYQGHIIFVTAYDDYALRAFEINALDYLMKPVHINRLTQAIQRLETNKEEVQKKRTTRHDKLHYDDQLFTTLGTKMQFLKINQIVLIQSDGDYTQVYTSNGKHGLANKTMKEWEERLPENHFLRVHRTSIVNTEYIDSIDKWFNYSYQIKLKGIEEAVIVSRRYAKKMKDLFG